MSLISHAAPVLFIGVRAKKKKSSLFFNATIVQSCMAIAPVLILKLYMTADLFALIGA